MTGDEPALGPNRPAIGSTNRPRFLDRYAAALAGILVATLHLLVAQLVPAGRFLKYTLAARGWLDGSLAGERIVDFSPLYLHLALAFERVTGDSFAALARLQFALVAIVAALLFRLLERRFGRVLAIAGVLVLAFDRRLLVYARVLEPELLLLALVLALLCFAEAGRTGWAAAAAALAFATRPSVLPLVAAVPLYWFLRDASRSVRGGLWRTVLYLSPTVVVAAALAFQAGRATGDAGSPRMNPGTVFFEGNHPTSRGISAEYPPLVRALAAEESADPDPAHADYRRVGRLDRGDPRLAVAELNRLWSARALSFVRDEPRAALDRLRRKLFYAFHAHPWHDVPAADAIERRLGALPAVPFSVIAALGLCGALLAARRPLESLLLFALAGGQTAVLAVFYVSARQQLLLLPALLLFGAGAARALLDRARPSRLRLAIGLGVALLAVPLSLPDAEMDAARGAQAAQARSDSHRQAALAARAAGDGARFHAEGTLALAHGARWLEQVWPAALSSPNGSPAARAAGQLEAAIVATALPAGIERDELRIDAAELWLEAESAERALAALSGVASDRPRAAVARSRAAALTGRHDEALASLHDALGRRPGDADLLGELVAVGEGAEAAAARRSLERYWGPSDARFVAGEALFAHRRSAEASAELEPLARAFPDLRALQLRLAIALAESGRLEAGFETLERELARRPEPLVSPLRAARAVARWRAERAGDAAAERRADLLLGLLGFAPPPVDVDSAALRPGE